ncbi:hypothetical protein Fcan01_26323 [Folsomia candida]|uniref:Uncharacterized protein n=1 Tax=Folsomia candida TaxID=158441 RepID=A0A226D178_FOLCA|nr:hypothetical protein Fcan01_26323 [Folsomia candida]
MGKLVVLLDLGMRKTCSKSGHAWSSTTTLLILLLLMAICCVGNHGSEVRGGTYKEVVATHPVASPLKQSGEDGVSVGIVNGGKPGIESYGNVTVLAGQRGELKCRTFNLANYTSVSFHPYLLCMSNSDTCPAMESSSSSSLSSSIDKPVITNSISAGAIINSAV